MLGARQAASAGWWKKLPPAWNVPPLKVKLDEPALDEIAQAQQTAAEIVAALVGRGDAHPEVAKDQVRATALRELGATRGSRSHKRVRDFKATLPPLRLYAALPS